MCSANSPSPPIGADRSAQRRAAARCPPIVTGRETPANAASPIAPPWLIGKVAAITLIYATCTDTCPLLTGKLAAFGQRTEDFGAKVAFVAVTVDPERDTPDVLRSYVEAHDARGAGLTRGALKG
jgi:cytochrome oxidase Cu insertion factor (SCO1/SenC/PrrC family)